MISPQIMTLIIIHVCHVTCRLSKKIAATSDLNLRATLPHFRYFDMVFRVRKKNHRHQHATITTTELQIKLFHTSTTFLPCIRVMRVRISTLSTNHDTHKALTHRRPNCRHARAPNQDDREDNPSARVARCMRACDACNLSTRSQKQQAERRSQTIVYTILYQTYWYRNGLVLLPFDLMFRTCACVCNCVYVAHVVLL